MATPLRYRTRGDLQWQYTENDVQASHADEVQYLQPVPESALSTFQLAAQLHTGQLDKAGRPYIEHLTRVFLRVQAAGGDTNQQIAALLHDAIEDGHATAEDLVRIGGVPREAVDLVVVLTKRPDQSYMDYLAGVKAVPRAALVKLADLEDNGDRTRLELLPEEECLRLREKYAKAVRFMTSNSGAE